MLHFICGRKGSGKTTYLHRLIGEKVKQHDAKVLLLVPKHFTFESDKRVLEIMGPRSAANVDVLSFSRLADTVLKTYRGTNKPILSDGANAVLMGLALESVKDRLSLFSRHYSNISFIQKMLDEIGTLKKEAVAPFQLDLAAKLLPEGLLRQKMLETALIYDAYDSLVAESFFDDRDILTLVSQVLCDCDFFDGKIVAIDNFVSFSGQERKIIERVIVGADEVYITACTDDLDCTNASSPFAAVNTAMRRIRTLAEKNFCKVAKPVYLKEGGADYFGFESEALAHLEKNLYSARPAVFEGECPQVTICEAPTVQAECDWTAGEIKRLLRTKQCRCRDIAVVYRNIEPYEKLIRHSFKKYGVPIFEDKRQPIKNEPLIIAVRAAISVCAEGFSTDSLMRYVKTDLAGVSRDEAAAAENYALMWELTSDGWQREWTDNPDGFGVEMNEDRRQKLKELNSIRERIVTPLAELKKRLQTSCGRDCMATIYEFITENKIDESLKEYALRLEETGNIELAIEQEQVWDILMQVLDQMESVMGDRTVPVKRLLEIFDLVVSAKSLGNLPNGFDEVYITGSDRVQTKTARVVFVVGMNSGLFPLAHSENGLFGELEKEKIRTVLPEIYDTAEQDAQNERFMVYSSLACARQRLYISYALSGAAGEKLTESETVTAVKRILPGCTRVQTIARPIEQLIESESAAFELTAKLWNEHSTKADTLRYYFSNKPEYKGKIDAIRRATERKPFGFEDKNTAKRLVGEGIRLSATRLEDYAKCPFMYFCRHELRAKPRKQARLDPASSGTLVHFVLEKLMKNHSDEPLSSLSPSELDSEIEEILSYYIDTYMGGSADKPKRFNYLYNRTLKILRTIVSRLVCEFSESDFEPCDFELRIDRDGSIKPFRVELDDGYIELRGIVDRVDKMDKNGKRYIRVVDYKTGTKTFSLSDVLGGLGMQMLLYLVSIWRNGGEYYGKDIVPAGVLYLPARFDPYSVERDDDEQTREQKKLASGKMDGMILDDGEVVKGMDRSLEGRFIPISKNKRTGAVGGTFISLEQLGKLSEEMDKIMAEMGNCLHEGKVPARPVYGKNHGDTCEWCDFKSVCMREPGDEIRYLESLTHSQCLARLDGGDDNEESLD